MTHFYEHWVVNGGVHQGGRGGGGGTSKPTNRQINTFLNIC